MSDKIVINRMLSLVDPQAAGLPEGAGRTTLKPAPEAEVGFWAQSTVSKALNRPGVSFLTRYIKREVSNWPLIFDNNWCYDRPPSFHAALTAFAPLLRAYHAQPLKLEGDADQVVNPRQFMQSLANHYEVDVNDVAGQYLHARNWLGIPTHTHPATLEGLINFLKMRGKQNVQN